MRMPSRPGTPSSWRANNGSRPRTRARACEQALVRAATLAGLLAPTPPRWLTAACERWQEVLADHAYCEKKAASTALALIFAYPEHEQQNLALARLAREELRHFEQVTKMMARLGVKFERLQPGRYAGRLREELAT